VTGERTTLVLIRHAESIANRMGFLGGHRSCRGLSDAGRRQAGALRDRLAGAGPPADALLCSRLARAVETARLIAPALAGGTLTPQSRCELCDVHWGALDGAPAEALAGADDLYRPVAPDGESWLMFERRCQRVLLRLAREFAGRTAVVVTHGGVIKSSLRVFGGVTGPESADAEVSYTGMTTWAADTGKRWHLAGYDDHAHLTVLSTVDSG
jgi:broad specificity phosphatase PhoE